MMEREARHLLFFRTWTAWHRARLPWWRKLILDARRPAAFARLIWRRALVARGAGNDFTAAGHRAMGIEVKARGRLGRRLAENDRRMGGDDARLLPPHLVPRRAQPRRRFV